MTGVNRTPRAPVVESRSPALVRFFTGVMRRQMHRNFHAVRLDKAGPLRLDPTRPALIYCNHPSWWDAALFIVLSDALMADRAAFGVMAQSSIRRYPFMARIGVFGIDHGDYRSTADFWRTANAILKTPRTLLWLNGEGTFSDVRARPIGLLAGAAHLARQPIDFDIVPMAIEYPFWDERLPEALCRFGEPTRSGAESRSVESWQRLLQERLTETMDGLAEQAITRDPDMFDVILKGRVGIGGVYDAWRRAKSAARGEKFVPDHGAPDR